MGHPPATPASSSAHPHSPPHASATRALSSHAPGGYTHPETTSHSGTVSTSSPLHVSTPRKTSLSTGGISL